MLYTSLLYAANERINQEGRILGLLPAVTNAILFNTTNADAVVSAMQIFPVTNPWNECISNRPVLVNSDAMIAQIISDLGANRAVLTPEFEMNFVLVPDNQPRKQIGFFNYPDESDLDGGTGTNGLYPIPTNLPIEEWPVADRHPDVVPMADEQRWERPARHYGGAGRRVHLGNVGDGAGGHELGGVQRRKVQPEHERAAAGGLDFGRRGGFPDVFRTGAL